MKILKYLALLVLAIVLILGGLMQYASESGEVVVLEVRDAAGATTETRLWVVDYDGDPWLRAGSPASAWAEQLVEAESVAVTRDNIRRAYSPQPDPSARDEINRLMAEKYAWRDQVIGAMVGGRDSALPIRLSKPND